MQCKARADGGWGTGDAPSPPLKSRCIVLRFGKLKNKMIPVKLNVLQVQIFVYELQDYLVVHILS